MTETNVPGPRSPGSLLWFFLAAGFGVRLVVSLVYPLIHHPDELFQYIEQAHRFVTGDGLVPWEHREGIRSWVVPGALVPLKWLADLLGDDPRLFTSAAYVAMSLFSLVIVWVGYQWTLRYHGTFAAAVVGALLAFSPVMLLYSPRVLTEVVATNFLFLAIAGPRALEAVSTRPRYFLIGVCLGLAFVIRFQIGGAVALLGIYLCQRDFRDRWLPAVSGGALVLLASGALDWATWDYPFQSIIRNYEMNIIEGVAARFGTTSFIDWTLNLGTGMFWFLPLLAVLGGLLFLGRGHNAGFLLMLLGVVGPLSMVGHKEVRYFYPAMPPALLVMGVGITRLIEARRSRPISAGATWATVAALAGVSLYFCFFGPLEKHFQRSRPFIDAALLLHERNDLCGLAIIDTPWADTGGYAFLNRSVPFYLVWAEEDQALRERPYNYALIRPEDREKFPSYETVRCWEDDDIFWWKDRVCILATERACEGELPQYEANHRMAELGQ